MGQIILVPFFLQNFIETWSDLFCGWIEYSFHFSPRNSTALRNNNVVIFSH